jgi:serine/threonine-protein kinase HipA
LAAGQLAHWSLSLLSYRRIKQPLTLRSAAWWKQRTRILSGREAFSANLDAGEERALKAILRVGTSAGGARPKAVIAYNPKTGDVRSGQTKVPEGYEHWLIKLDGVSDTQFGQSLGWGRVEYAYYLMATACGIEMMESRMLEENGRAHFMTKRFDREAGNIKHHIQTLCGLQHFDYNNIRLQL